MYIINKISSSLTTFYWKTKFFCFLFIFPLVKIVYCPTDISIFFLSMENFNIQDTRLLVITLNSTAWSQRELQYRLTIYCSTSI